MSNRTKTSQVQLLAEQRGRLLERIAQQRAVLQVQWAPLQQAASKADHALALAARMRGYVQAHRKTFTLALCLACVGWVLIKPGRSVRLLKSGLVLWRGWRAIQSAQFFAPGSFWGSVYNLARRRFSSAENS